MLTIRLYWRGGPRIAWKTRRYSWSIGVKRERYETAAQRDLRISNRVYAEQMRDHQRTAALEVARFTGRETLV